MLSWSDRRLLTLVLFLLPVLILLTGYNAYAVKHNADERRREGAISGALTFYLVCRDYRGAELSRIREQHAKLDQNLKLLHLKHTPHLDRVVAKQYAADLKRWRLSACSELPTVRRVSNAYGVRFSPKGVIP